MKKKFLWFAILGVTALVSITVMAESASSKGTKGMASTPDSNILKDSMANSKDNMIAAPESKGGPKSRGLNGTCNIHVNNATALYVTFYFNGVAAGALGPWGDLYPNSTEGRGTLYARAVFTDGSAMTFGPRDFTCTGTDFVWTLTP
jgi:hypothetical protein